MFITRYYHRYHRDCRYKELTSFNTKACQTDKFEKFYIGVSCQSDNLECKEEHDEFYDIPLNSVPLQPIERQINYKGEIKDILHLEKYGL